ncbi:MAG TPA: AAA family ATPase, partial [Acidimicrobiales bacterium]
LVHSGEGGRLPWLRRYAAVCEAYGLEPAALRGWVRFTTQTASVTSPKFSDGLRAELETFGPAVVFLDPWYAYASGQADSRQVTEVGNALESYAALCRQHDASALLAHHFNRQETVGLRQITGAGHAEWVDSWFLLGHRVKPDPGKGEYKLRLDVGSRQWGGAAYDLDFAIDPALRTIRWNITEAAAGAPDEGNPLTDTEQELRRIGAEASEPMTRAVWLVQCKRRAEVKNAAFDELLRKGIVISVGAERHGTRKVEMYRVAPEWIAP